MIKPLALLEDVLAGRYLLPRFGHRQRHDGAPAPIRARVGLQMRLADVVSGLAIEYRHLGSPLLRIPSQSRADPASLERQ